MKIAFAGGTGFTGRRVAARLIEKGYELQVLVRASSDLSKLPKGVTTVVGDLHDKASLAAWYAGCDSLVYCASMGHGHIPKIVEAAEEAGIKRAVFISTTALFTKINAKSKVVRTAAEDAVRASKLDYTIVRPTMIYGEPGDRNMERLLQQVSRRPIIFMPGTGKALMQPIHVDDLADAVVAAFLTPIAARKEYNVSGKQPLTFDATIEAAGRAVGKSPMKLHLPLKSVASTLGFLEKAKIPFPIKSEQVMRLAEDKAFSHEEAARDLGFSPRTFEEGITGEAKALGLSK